ncbi:MAG: hypothetical protein KGQ52_08175 [Alphaproteobacteria bacterium]|nr:hypothetical protein [Alphaproteobacteria bacterium]
MADFAAMPLTAMTGQGPIVVRPRLFCVSWPDRLARPARAPVPGQAPVPVGEARATNSGALFSVAPGACHVCLDDATTVFGSVTDALTTNCSDALLQWVMQPNHLDALVAAYAAFALPQLLPGSATALSIAGERMMLARPSNGPIWLFHELALFDWFSSLMIRIGIHDNSQNK